MLSSKLLEEFRDSTEVLTNMISSGKMSSVISLLSSLAAPAIIIAASCFDCVLVRIGFELLFGRPLEKKYSKRVRNEGMAGQNVNSPPPLFMDRIAVIV